MNEQEIYSLSRPHPKLLSLYVIHSILSGPAILFTLPLSLFRYYTMEYKFDPSGFSMSWGFLFKRQITLSYSRIQDIHLESGVIQRWLGLADIQIQTASGSSDAEAVIEGIVEYESLRDFLYSKMRGFKHLDAKAQAASAAPSASPLAAAEFQAGASASSEELELLGKIAAELAGARLAAERLASRNGGAS